MPWGAFGVEPWRESLAWRQGGSAARCCVCTPAGHGGSLPSQTRVTDPALHRPRYRKVVSNMCEGGVDLQQSPVQLQCPLTPPRGLQVSLRGEAVAVRPGVDVFFVVQQEQVSGGM